MGRTSKSQAVLTEVANMLAAAVANSGIQQRDLAAHLNVSEARVSQILSGKSNLTIQTLAKIADILQMELRIGLYGSKQ